MADRYNPNEGPSVNGVSRGDETATLRRLERPANVTEEGPRRPPGKFGAAADGWDAYNAWIDRVRQPAPPSRHAVVAKSLHSLSSYKNWADKARGAFEPSGTPVPTGVGKLK